MGLVTVQADDECRRRRRQLLRVGGLVPDRQSVPHVRRTIRMTVRAVHVSLIRRRSRGIERPQQSGVRRTCRYTGGSVAVVAVAALLRRRTVGRSVRSDHVVRCIDEGCLHIDGTAEGVNAVTDIAQPHVVGVYAREKRGVDCPGVRWGAPSCRRSRCVAAVTHRARVRLRLRGDVGRKTQRRIGRLSPGNDKRAEHDQGSRQHHKRPAQRGYAVASNHARASQSDEVVSTRADSAAISSIAIAPLAAASSIAAARSIAAC